MIDDHVRRMEPMDSDQKRAYLQQLIGTPSENADVLHFRALLITELSKARVWPHNRSREIAE